METLLSFYRGKRVLVTGHTGFKGGWLASWLKALGAEVTGVALAPETSPNLYELARIGEGMTSEIADIRDRQRMADIISAADPEVVFHLAAQPLVRRSYADPVATYETNVLGTANVLDALRHGGAVRSIVVVTSDKCYENKEWEWGYRENDPLGGHDPYSSSKACTEIVAAAFRSSYFAGSLPTVGLATARAGNVIGGGDWSEDRIVPDIVRSISSDQPVVLRNPDAYRPWQHVLEPLYGYLLLGMRLWDEPERFAGAWNFGPTDDDTTTVLALASRVVEHWGRGEIEIRRPPKAVHEANALRLDSRKAIAQLGWSPVLTFDRLIEITVAWYETVLANTAEAATITQRQIADFSEAAARRRVARSVAIDVDPLLPVAAGISR